MQHNIFVYGTLKQGEERAHLWPHPPRRIINAVVRGALFDLGPYPAMIDGNDLVLGELWSFDPAHLAETLQVLDEIEGFQTGSPQNLYLRVTVTATSLQGEEQEAFSYRFADPHALATARRIQPPTTVPAKQRFVRWSSGPNATG